MFDDGIVRLIEGSDIDRPRNALTLPLIYINFSEILKYSLSAQPNHHILTELIRRDPALCETQFFLYFVPST